MTGKRFVNLLATLALLVVTFATLRISLANGLSRSRPELASSIDGSNAIAAARTAAAMLPEQGTGDAINRIAALATGALIRDPTQVVAASTLALTRDVKGDHTGAGRLMAYSQRVSQRDLATQLWLIEEAVRKGNIDAALDHYDIALRTSKRAPRILFPVLVGAIADPAIVDPLTAKVAREPNWAGGLLFELVRQDAAPANVARLFVTLAQRSANYDQRNAELFIQRRVAAGDVANAWQVYRSIEPSGSALALRDGTFSDATPRPVPFEWELTDQNELAAVRDDSSAGKVLRLRANTGAGGVVARQLVRLAPGSHTMSGTVADVDLPAGSLPYITVTCFTSQARLASIDLPTAPERGRRFDRGLTIPASRCSAQWVEIWLRASYGVGGVNVTLKRLSLD